MEQAATHYAATRQRQRVFAELEYAAQTWDRVRRVIVKAGHTDKGRNPRFVVTNLDGDGQWLYDQLYCARGEMENRIKEQQLGLFADRTSCHGWWANQWQLLLSSLAYTVMEALRRLGLAGTELARDDPVEAAEDRGRAGAQHPARALSVGDQLSVSSVVRHGGGALGERVATIGAVPGTGNNGG